MVGAGGWGAPASLLWDRVRERDLFPSEAALDREAVRERDRRVMQDEATVRRREREKKKRAESDKDLAREGAVFQSQGLPLKSHEHVMTFPRSGVPSTSTTTCKTKQG